MKKTILIVFLQILLVSVIAFVTEKVKADCTDMWDTGDTGGTSYIGGGGDWSDYWNPPSTSAGDFSSAESAANVSNTVDAMIEGAQKDGQMIPTTTGYATFSQNGYYWRVDPDGRGFTQLGVNNQTGALIDSNTGQTVDYIKGYGDYTGGGTGAGGNGTGGGGGGDTGTGVNIDIDQQVKLPGGGYGFMGNDNNVYQVQNDQWVQVSKYRRGWDFFRGPKRSYESRRNRPVWKINIQRRRHRKHL